jgi:hypothetical protein
MRVNLAVRFNARKAKVELPSRERRLKKLISSVVANATERLI